MVPPVNLNGPITGDPVANPGGRLGQGQTRAGEMAPEKKGRKLLFKTTKVLLRPEVEKRAMERVLTCELSEYPKHEEKAEGGSPEIVHYKIGTI